METATGTVLITRDQIQQRIADLGQQITADYAGRSITFVGILKGSFVFLTPTRQTDREALRSVSSLWKRLGASVQMVSPEKHDQIVSQISHLPHAVASLLMQSIDSKALRFAGTGFRDTTRIAQGDPRLWVPVFVSNKANLIRDLTRFKKMSEKLLASLKGNSRLVLRGFLKAASSKRAQI